MSLLHRAAKSRARPVRDALCALGALCALDGCRPRPTQIKLNLNTDVSAAREQTLSITVLHGARTLDELQRAQGSITRLTNDTRPVFPGSVSLVPATAGPRDALVSMLATLTVPASGGQPALRIERVQRMRFIEHTPQEGYLFFNAECGSPSSGCTTVEASACTVGRRCLERGLTCGDDGVCIGLELPLRIVPNDTPLDAGPEDASAPRDASIDRAEASTADVVDVMDGSAVVDAAPSTPARLVAPMSTSTVTSRRPSLRWAPASASATSEVRLCRDRALTAECTMITAPGATTSVRPASELTAGVWFWQVRSTDGARALPPSATWQFRVGIRSADADRDTRWGAEADFNGDGLGDVAIGAIGTARVLVVAGAATNYSAVTPTVLDGGAIGGRFGASVASAGDLNGDGFSELVVGAPDADVARVYWGSAQGIRSANPTDLRGPAAGSFGTSVAGLGDVNGDGYGDLAVGAYLASATGRSSAGIVTIYLGSAAGISASSTRVLEGVLGGDWFGFSVAGAGDVNGDGLADVLVGAYGADSGGRTNCGSASVFLGAATGVSTSPARVLVGANAADEIAWSVSSAGDMNGDGFSDIIVGSPWTDPAGADSGRTQVFYGSALGVEANPAITIAGAAPNELLGWSVATLGDFNGDGFSDVVLGAKGTASAGMNTGSVVLRMGGAGARQNVINGRVARGEFGSAVSGAGDVNGDGLADLVAGARTETVAGMDAAGSASVYLGSMLLPASAPLRVFTGESVMEQLGGAVAARSFDRRRWRAMR